MQSQRENHSLSSWSPIHLREKSSFNTQQICPFYWNLHWLFALLFRGQLHKGTVGEIGKRSLFQGPEQNQLLLWLPAHEALTGHELMNFWTHKLKRSIIWGLWCSLPNRGRYRARQAECSLGAARKSDLCLQIHPPGSALCNWGPHRHYPPSS